MTKSAKSAKTAKSAKSAASAQPAAAAAPAAAGTLAAALLEAHVAFVLAQLEGEPLETLLQQGVALVLADARKLKLNDMVTRQQIKDTARTYAAELEIRGGIPELVGDIARRIYEHPQLAETAAANVVSKRTVSEILDKSLELQSLREAIVHGVLDSPLYARFASELLYNGIRGYLAQNTLTDNIPGARSMLKLGKAVLSRATPNLEASVEEGLKGYIGKSIGMVSQRSVGPLISADNNPLLREAILEFWEQLKSIPFAELRQHLTSLDVEEFFVMGYDFWRELRSKPIYMALIEAGIDGFFDKYAKHTLAELLHDLDITEELMVKEGMRHAPHALAVLKKKKLLEPLVRRTLEPFYRSAAVARILAG